jgi:FKBP-type peptidyl-prolyl cis-trans isomerase SlpA
LELEDGAVVDSTFDRTPAAFTIGDGSLLPGFERALVGLGAGALCDVMLEPDMAFGRSNPDNVQRVPLYRFPPDLVLGKGVMVEFTEAAGFGQAGVIRQVGKQYAEVDFNHPLADRRVRFRALIHRVEAAEPL